MPSCELPEVIIHADGGLTPAPPPGQMFQHKQLQGIGWDLELKASHMEHLVHFPCALRSEISLHCIPPTERCWAGEGEGPIRSCWTGEDASEQWRLYDDSSVAQAACVFTTYRTFKLPVALVNKQEENPTVDDRQERLFLCLYDVDGERFVWNVSKGCQL